MNWTKQTPTQTGWYWWRQDSSKPAAVVYLAGKLECLQVFSFHSHPAVSMGGEWAGPLRPPAGEPIENQKPAAREPVPGCAEPLRKHGVSYYGEASSEGAD